MSPALRVMELVASRDAATLLPIIQRHVWLGTIVWSDMWMVYNDVQHLPAVAQHQMVNHSIEFFNSATRVHTQHMKQDKNEDQENESLP